MQVRAGPVSGNPTSNIQQRASKHLQLSHQRLAAVEKGQLFHSYATQCRQGQFSHNKIALDDTNYYRVVVVRFFFGKTCTWSLKLGNYIKVEESWLSNEGL